MQIFIADLHEDAAAVGEKFPRHRQPVAQIGEIGMNAERPGVAISLNHLRLARQVLLAVFHVALAELRLEVGGEFDAVRRVEINHLHLARQVFAPREAGHHLQRVAENHAVRPVHVNLVELHRLGVIQLRVGKQVALHILPRQHAQNCLRGNPLMQMQRHRLDFKPRLLALAAPFQPRLMPAQRVGQLLGLVRRERPLPRKPQQFGKLVGLDRIRRRTQHGRQVRIIFVADFGRVLEDALRGESGGRIVFPLAGIFI